MEEQLCGCLGERRHPKQQSYLHCTMIVFDSSTAMGLQLPGSLENNTAQGGKTVQFFNVPTQLNVGVNGALSAGMPSTFIFIVTVVVELELLPCFRQQLIEAAHGTRYK